MDQRVTNFVIRAQAQHRAARTASDHQQLDQRIEAYAKSCGLSVAELTRLVKG